MSEQAQKADLMPRFLASLVDGLIGSIPLFVPVIGALVGTAYLLTKDTIMYEITKDAQWKNKSIGKKLFRLEVRPDESTHVDWATSIKRNITLSLGSIVSIIPIIGWVIGPIIFILLFLAEVILVLTNPEGKRLGDRIAKTMVVPDESATAQGHV